MFWSVVKLAAVVAVLAGLHALLHGCGALGQIENALDGVRRLDVFVLAMSIGCAFAFPLSICYLLAGAAFPIWQAWPACLAVLFFSSGIGFWAGRKLVPKRIFGALCEKFKPRAGGKVGAGLFRLNFIVRTFPGIPYWIQNIFLARIGTPYKLYTAVNMAAQGMISLAMTALGNSLKQPDTATFAAILLLVIGIAAAYKLLFAAFVGEDCREK